MSKLVKLLSLPLLNILSIDTPIIKKEAGQKDVLLSNSIIYQSEQSYYEPIEDGEMLTINGNLTYIGEVTFDECRLSCKLISPKRNDGNVFSSLYMSNSSYTIYPSYSENYSFRLRYAASDAKYGLTVRLGFYSDLKEKFIDYTEFVIWSEEKEDIDVDEHITYPYEIARTYDVNGNVYKESYLFDHYSHYLYIDTYYRLYLNDMTFVYQYIKGFICQLATLSFVDTYNLFPYINANEQGKKVVPLIYHETNNIVSLAFNELYVNPKNLNISLEPQNGFVLTNYFYLPINHKEQLEDYSFEIELVDCGVNKSHISYVFEIDLSRLLLGPCDQAAYCVIGGVLE